MNFRAPHMNYLPRQMEAWERFIAFTIVFQPMESLEESLAGLVRRREGAIGETVGEQRPPLMAQTQTPGQQFNGTLVFQPKEAPGLTVIEHPLDHVALESFSNALAKVLPDERIITFWSDLDTSTRQSHGYKVIEKGNRARYVELSRGYNSQSWEWDEAGEVQPLEDVSRLQKKQIWHRLDRALIFDYASKAGLDPKRSLFAREFGQSVLYWPLPVDAPEAATSLANHAKSADAAKAAGVAGFFGMEELNQSDAEFVSTAKMMKVMVHWDRALSALLYKAGQSAQRAKTPKGRERAQWRVIEGLTQWKKDMEAIGMTRGHRMITLPFNKTMKELGTDTEAYRVYTSRFPNPWEIWRRSN